MSLCPCHFPLNLSQSCSVLSGIGPSVPEMQIPWKLKSWPPSIFPISFPDTSQLMYFPSLQMDTEIKIIQCQRSGS